MTTLPVSLEDIEQAAKRIKRHIIKTPLLEAPLLQKELGFRLLVKAENVQMSGSFKVRGAFNQLSQLTDEEKRKGVVAISSGNHAQAVAYAASVFNVKAVIVMPHDAPRLKLENTKRYGAEVITYNRDTEDREEVGAKLVKERGARMIHPYNDPRTIAGQGTVGLEIYKQCKKLNVTPAAIVVNCGGGGLSSGISLSRELYDGEKPTIYTAEPEGFDGMRKSFAAGKIMKNDKLGGSICDALLMSPGPNTLPILMHQQAKGFSASDMVVEAAMNLAAEYFKLVVEPGGAVSIACACLNRDMFRGKTVVAVASGGNVDPGAYVDMLKRGQKNMSLLNGTK